MKIRDISAYSDGSVLLVLSVLSGSHPSHFTLSIAVIMTLTSTLLLILMNIFLSLLGSTIESKSLAGITLPDSGPFVHDIRVGNIVLKLF